MRKNLDLLLLSMSNACSCLASADGCQTLKSQTLCSAGVGLWSLLTNSNGLFLSGGDLGLLCQTGISHQGRRCVFFFFFFFLYCFTWRNWLSAERKNLVETVTRCMATFCSLSVINVWTANPLCTYNTHISVTDLMHTQAGEHCHFITVREIAGGSSAVICIYTLVEQNFWMKILKHYCTFPNVHHPPLYYWQSFLECWSCTLHWLCRRLFPSHESKCTCDKHCLLLSLIESIN